MSRRRSREELKHLVSWLRGYLGIEGIARPDMLLVLSNAERLFQDFSYRRVSDHTLPDGKEAAHAEGEILITNRTFRALETNDARARFTIAHELAHFVLGHPEVRFRGQLKAYERASRHVRIDEAEANEFASLFLAPDELIRETDTTNDLVCRLGISQRAAEIRKGEFDADIRKQRGEPRRTPAKVIDFLTRQEAKGYKIRAPELLRRPPHNTNVALSPTPRILDARVAATPAYEASPCDECGHCTVMRHGRSRVCHTCGHSSDPN